MGTLTPASASHRQSPHAKTRGPQRFLAISIIATLALMGGGCGAGDADHNVGGASTSSAVQPGSALVTDGQREQEALAREILATDVLREEVERVKALYAADPRGATPAGAATTSRAANAISTGAALYAVSEDPDRPVLVWGVTAPHEFSGLNMPRSGYGIENPDNVYRKATVAGNASYEIRGKITEPGPAELHFELRDAIPGTTGLSPEAGTQLGNLSSDAIKVGDDGSFVITVDSSPADGRPNHLQIPKDGTTFVLVRDLLNDWSRENPVGLEIERISGPPISAPKSVEQLAARSTEILSKIAPFWVSYFDKFIYSAPSNTLIPVRERPGARGFSTNGWFDLADDEALVVTLDPVGAKSLGIQISDPWGVAYEYRDRTSSLNTTQSKPNPDGTYTFVVSKNDPGVFNWLDPEDKGSGMFAVRWQALPGASAIDRAVRDVRLIKSEALRDALPPNTTFVTADERKSQQSERAASYDRRMNE